MTMGADGAVEDVTAAAIYFFWIVGVLVLPSALIMLALVRSPRCWWAATAVTFLAPIVGLVLCNRAADGFQGIGLLFSTAWLYGGGLVLAIGIIDRSITRRSPA